MHIELEENALDSLKYGLEYYEKFLNLVDKYRTDNPTYLKMALIMIHNSVELFIKKALSNINELLIYSDLSNEKFLEIYSRRIESDIEISLDEFMTGDEYSIHTVDYTTLIKRFKTICGLNSKEFINLDWLGKYRNKVNHFGIDMTIEYNRILTVINNALDLLTGVIYKHLISNKQGNIILDSVYEQILDLLEIGQYEEEAAWAAYYSDNFVEINSYIQELENDIDFKKLLKEKNYKLEIEQGSYSDSSWVFINFINEIEEKSEYISIKNDLFYNVTLFVGESIDGPIYFVLDHNEYLISEEDAKCFYIYNKPTFIENIAEQSSKFWESHIRNKLCYKVEFNYEQFIRGLNKILR